MPVLSEESLPTFAFFSPPPIFVIPVSNHFSLQAIDAPRLLKFTHISSDSLGWTGNSSSVHSLLLSCALEDKMRHPGQTIWISYFCHSLAKSALSEYFSDSLTLLTQIKKYDLGTTTDKAKHQSWKQVKTLLVFSGFNPRASPVIIKFSCSTKLGCAVDFLKKWGIEEGSTQIGALGNI